MNSIKIPNGTGGRWAIGVIILTQLIAFNETEGNGAIFAITIAAVLSIFSGICKSSVKNVQIAYLRMSHKCDFLYLFLAVWMDILSLLSACSALARILSTCLDTMTGGLARMWILGRNSTPNEPWPDVLGVAVVFLITGMFMLGLENTKIFSVLMILGIIGFCGILCAATWIKDPSESWTENLLASKTDAILMFSAICACSFPTEFPSVGRYKKITGLCIIFIIFITNILTVGCLSMLIGHKSQKEFNALPIISFFETQNFQNIIPALACLLVLACSGAILELFPEMYNLVVLLTKSEWDILAKQIGYENRESGSPVLAIFTAGSLCAMLAFACPLQILIHILAASNLLAIIFRGIFLLYSPFRPKYIHQQTESSSSAYSRLDAGPGPSNKPSGLKRILLFFNKSKVTVSQMAPKPKTKKTRTEEELEREWLLLGEPPSPRSTSHPQNEESSILSEIELVVSDPDCIEHTDSESSTDIDAIVDEYRQKLKISTINPREKLNFPSTCTWNFALFGILIILAGIIITVIGIQIKTASLIIVGFLMGQITTLFLLWLPKNKTTYCQLISVICVGTLYISFILISYVLPNSWPAILFWVISGIILFLRCDTWCCFCFNGTDLISIQNLKPSTSTKLATIHIPHNSRATLLSTSLSEDR